MAQTKKNMFWNGLVNSLIISYFKNCITLGNQIRLLVMGSIFVKAGDVTAAFILILAICLLISRISLFLWSNYDKLGSDQMTEK